MSLTFDPEKHEYFWNGIKKPCVSDIMESVSPFMIPLKDLDDVKKMKRWYALSEAIKIKAPYGTVTHLYLEMYDNGTLDPDETKWDSQMIPVVASWLRFKDQYDLNGKPTCEERFYNEALGYAGTRDRRWPGCIVEIKTCQPNDTTGVQLAAYAAPLPDAADHRLIACFLDDKGSFKVREYNYKKYFNTFMCCHHVYNFKNGAK